MSQSSFAVACDLSEVRDIQTCILQVTPLFAKFCSLFLELGIFAGCWKFWPLWLRSV